MLRKSLYLVVILCLTASFSLSQKTSDKASTQTDMAKTVTTANKTINIVKLIEGKITTIYDGDTIGIKTKDGKTYVILMQNIDAPEEKQNYGTKSKEQLSNLILDKDVTVLVRQMDQNNHYHGTVYYSGQDMNLKQIETGMAWYFKQLEYEQNVNDSRVYIQAEQKARLKHKGLWQDKNPTPPWDFKDNKITEDKSVKANNEKQTQPELILDKPNTKVKSEDNSKNLPSRKYIQGPRGGCYYINSGGGKTYVDRGLCQK